jgi:hypothetical protein
MIVEGWEETAMNPKLIGLMLAAAVAVTLGSERASANPIAYEATVESSGALLKAASSTV